jgi:hypothetical protein
MDEEAVQLLREIRSDLKGVRICVFMLFLGIVGFAVMNMIVLQEFRAEMRAALPGLQ